MNLVKTNDPARPADGPEVYEDYAASLATLQDRADYVALNMSCPNSAADRDFFDDLTARRRPARAARALRPARAGVPEAQADARRRRAARDRRDRRPPPVRLRLRHQPAVGQAGRPQPDLAALFAGAHAGRGRRTAGRGLRQRDPRDAAVDRRRRQPLRADRRGRRLDRGRRLPQAAPGSDDASSSTRASSTTARAREGDPRRVSPRCSSATGSSACPTRSVSRRRSRRGQRAAEERLDRQPRRLVGERPEPQRRAVRVLLAHGYAEVHPLQPPRLLAGASRGRWRRDSGRRSRSARLRRARSTAGPAPTSARSRRAAPCTGRGRSARRARGRCAVPTTPGHPASATAVAKRARRGRSAVSALRSCPCAGAPHHDAARGGLGGPPHVSFSLRRLRGAVRRRQGPSSAPARRRSPAGPSGRAHRRHGR